MLRIFNWLLMLLVACYGVYALYLRRKNAQGVELLRQQERFMGNLVSEYGANENLMEALESAMDPEDKRFNRQNGRLMDALLEGADSDGAAYFIKNAANSYLSLLFALCVTIRTFGDTVYQGVSLFARNLRYIKDEVRAELLLSDERKYLFAGLELLATAPFFFTVPIERWAVGISADMQSYYRGMYGFVTLLVCFFATAGALWMILLMEYPRSAGGMDGVVSHRLLALDWYAHLLDRHIASRYSAYLRQNEELKRLSVYADIRLFLSDRIVCGVAGGLCAAGIVSAWLGFGGGRRVLYGAAVLICGAFLAGFWLPKLRLVIYHYRNSSRKMEETLRFQTLILLLMHYPDITVEELLGWMERFSEVFRESMERAVDDFSYRRQKALSRLKEELSYEPAVRIAESLAACDEIPVEKAFYDLESEREYYMEQYKQSAFDSQKERAALSRIIAFVPFVTVLALRLIVPFVMTGLSQLSQYAELFA